MKAVPLFSGTRRGSVSSVGEAELIRMIVRWLGRASPRAPAGIGDDCAVLRPARGRELLTVDPVVFGVHFDRHVPPRSVGAKLLKRNLSDIAAMGGRPRAAVVALALDERVSLRWLAEFYRGLAVQSLRHRVPVVGGDVARLPGSFVATVALTGESTGRVLTRAGSRAGDWIYVTGSLGRSLPSGHHHLFEPRLSEGAWLARRPEVRAMMDVSDGLAKDLQALAPRGSEPALFEAMIPLRRGASTREALCDGEDYELVFSVAARAARPAFEAAWRKKFRGTRLSCIGRFARTGSVPVDALSLEDCRGTSICDRLRAGVATRSAEETRAVAAQWAAVLPADATVALHGDLGAGKTTWVQGMALGFGITEPVTSPTFTIYNLHRGKERMLAHLDAYRLGSPEEAEELLLEEFLVSPWCLAIEWPERLPGWVGSDALHLDLDIAADGRHTVRLR